MRKVVRLDTKSTMRLFAVFYALMGVYAVVEGVLDGVNTVACPLGFLYPVAHAYITINLNMSHPADISTLGLVVIGIVVFGITGAVSGIPLILIYNVLGRWWPLFLAEVAPEAPPTPSPTREQLWPDA